MAEKNSSDNVIDITPVSKNPFKRLATKYPRTTKVAGAITALSAVVGGVLMVSKLSRSDDTTETADDTVVADFDPTTETYTVTEA